MNVYKKFCLNFFRLFLIILFCFGGFLFLIWLYDPFWLFHKPYFREQTYQKDMANQAKGIIDNTDFNGVILGTSMLENTSAKEAGEKLGNKWVNLSIKGANFEDRNIIFKYITKHKKNKICNLFT